MAATFSDEPSMPDVGISAVVRVNGALNGSGNCVEAEAEVRVDRVGLRDRAVAKNGCELSWKCLPAV